MSFPTPGPKQELEQGLTFTPKFDQYGLIPAIAQDHLTGQILMLAYMTAEAFAKTLELGQAVYYSRSRQELWHKGATSGQYQIVHQILTDCDQDALILRVEQLGGGACHTGANSCFYRAVPLGQTPEHPKLTPVSDPD
ncbi:phosphoribosyl-AMP cyclohydrolase [Armatimonadetes bacterium Uphvl-Ar1]|nr:phosphoribosyl-AMP cyclohydrolase [Armatimonadetes bacterium Uphvl-Ar1]